MALVCYFQNMKLRSQVDDLHNKNDGLARENKGLSDRLRDCEGNLKDANRSVAVKIVGYILYRNVT